MDFLVFPSFVSSAFMPFRARNPPNSALLVVYPKAKLRKEMVIATLLGNVVEVWVFNHHLGFGFVVMAQEKTPLGTCLR